MLKSVEILMIPTMTKRNLKAFKDWTAYDIRNRLDVQVINQPPILQEWLTLRGEIPQDHQPFLEELRSVLTEYHQSWNEMELAMRFIGPLFTLLKFYGAHFNLFQTRELSGKVGDYHVSGVVDGLVASGHNEPEIPYFFFHEYKRFKTGDSEPLGQLLIAMLLAFSTNPTRSPIYGCYVFGSIWRFVIVYEENHQLCYAQSGGYDAIAKDDLTAIWLILDKTKQIIAQITQENYDSLPVV